MTVFVRLAWLLALVATSVIADSPLEALKEGAAKAARTVGDTTMGAVETAGAMAGKASTAVSDTVDSSKKGLRDEASPAETRAKLDTMAETTLARLFADEPGSRELFARSVGYAVFDKREASFYVVAGYGRGVAVDTNSGERVYMKMATSGAGLSFGLGGFASQLVILFEDSGTFQRFITEGLDATAEVSTLAGDAQERLALRFNEGKAVFVLTGKGWKLAARLTGSRYWSDAPLNAR